MSTSLESRKSWIKTLLIYLFLLYLAFLVADLVLLKFVRPQFLIQSTKGASASLGSLNEPESGAFSSSEMGSKDLLTSKSIERNIFNSKQMPPALASLEQQNEVGEEYEDNVPVKTSLSLVLEGTAVHRDPFKSIATIRGKESTLSYLVEDEVDSVAKVVSVLRKKVIFRNLQNKKLEYIEIERNKPMARKRVVKRPSLGSPVMSSGPVKREGNRFTTSRAEVNRYTSNFRALLTQANNKPVTDPATGEVIGFEIFAIKPGSVIEQLGIKNGDVIKEVNGIKINNPGKALSLYNKLQKSSNVNLVFDRNGREEEHQYFIEE